MKIAVVNPQSWEDVVELLVPELQKRGLYWDDYPVPGGTLRENVSNQPGHSRLADDHPGAKVRWDAQKEQNGSAVDGIAVNGNGVNGHGTHTNGA